jgi:hypothetical protein
MFLLKKQKLEKIIVKKNLPIIQNNILGPIIFMYFQEMYTLEHIESINPCFLNENIIGDKDNNIDSKIPGIIKNIKPN